MGRLRAWLVRVAGLFNKRRRERELAEELESHLQMHIADNLRAGMSPPEARRQALIKLGGLEQAKENYRDRRGLPMIETLIQDVRYGLRQLRRSPGFTAVAVLTLALGIGANTAIFSLIDAVMLRMLPVQKAEELVEIVRHDPRWGEQAYYTDPLWEQVRDRQDVFSGAFAWGTDKFDLAQGGAAQNANGVFASGGYFTTLGARAAAGRLINATDDQRGCPAVAVLSYGFWQDHYGGAESAIGKTLSLNQHPFQIIGASAPGFYGTDVGQKFDIAIPICTAAIFDGKESRLDHRSWWWLRIIARVKPGMSPDQVQARLAVLSPQISAAALPLNWPQKNQEAFLKQSLVALPAATGTSGLRRRFTEPLDILMAVVGLVLLIACGNIASLMLARAATRHKEIAVRQALGAPRMRLVRQLLTECVLLSSAGALVGILFARWGSALLVRYISTRHEQVFLDLSPDFRVFGFTAAVAVLTGVLFGVLPAFRSTRVSLTSAMKGREDTERSGHSRGGKWIVAFQVALSLVLLVAAGLFLRSFRKLATLDIGFDRNNVLLVNVNLKAANLPPEQGLAVCEQLENRLRALPGVVAAGRSWNTPVSGYEWNNFIVADSPNAPTGEASLAYFNSVSPAYFETLRTPILSGRAFDAHDTKTAPFVAIVNQTLARKFFPNLNPIGRYFRKEELPGKPVQPIQIVGVAKDSKYESIREETYSMAFFPIAQQTLGSGQDETFELRTVTPPSSLVSPVQNAIGEVNKEISLDFHTLAEQVNDSLVQERLLAGLSAFFGGLALLLAMVGLYGALSYMVTRRQAEFGIRMALGAEAGSILSLVMQDMAVILAGGIVAGALISLAATRVLAKLLFGLGARDPVTLAGAVAVLSAVAFVAGLVPARRATKVDPMVALRCE